MEESLLLVLKDTHQRPNIRRYLYVELIALLDAYLWLLDKADTRWGTCDDHRPCW